MRMFSSASKKLFEVVINASQTMVDLEGVSPGNTYFSYVKFSFRILRQLAQLPSADLAVAALVESSRRSLNVLIDLFSSIPEYCDATDSLEQLKQ